MPNPGRRPPLPYRDARPKSKLCDRCRVNLNFNDRELGGYEGRDENGSPFLKFDDVWTYREFVRPLKIHDNLPGLPFLKASAETGCDFCWMLRKVISQDSTLKAVTMRVMIELKYTWGNAENISGVSRNKYRTPQGLYPGLVALIATMQCALTKGSSRKPVYFAFWISSDSESIRSWLQCERPLGVTPLCEGNVAWLQQEIQEHEEIRPRNTEQAFLPTRLIEILSVSKSPRLRLIDTADGHPRLPKITYAALSYCWGREESSRPQLKTTKSNLKDMLGSIPPQKITPVLKDALKVCDALSIKYLWVDALCIQQNCKEDWEHESEMMDLIFGNAHVTICPLSSWSYNVGFLHRSQDHISIRFESHVVANIRGSILIRPTASPREFFHENALGMDLSSSLWHTRGWVVQEQLFSRRLILFGEDRLHFITPPTYYSAEGSLASNYVHSFDFFLDLSSKSSGDGSLPDLYKRFYDISTAISSCDFTMPDDRLPAISGLARKLSSILDDVYLAGLWKKSLHYGLLWYIGPILHNIHQRLKNQSADEPFPLPSWTWASRKEYHEFGTPVPSLSIDKHLRPDWESLDSSNIPETGHKFVAKGSLRIRTKVKRLPPVFTRHRTATVYPMWSIKQGNTYVANCSFDWDEPLLVDDYSSLRLLLLSSSCSGPLTGAYPLDDLSPSPTLLESLPGEGSITSQEYSCTPTPHFKSSSSGKTVTTTPQSGRRHSSSSMSSHISGITTPSGMRDGDSGREIGDLMMIGTDNNYYDAGDYGNLFTYIEARDTCEKCRDTNHNRHAWGLVICPAEQPGQYYRAGVFTSRAYEAGGTRWFEDAESETIELL